MQTLTIASVKPLNLKSMPDRNVLDYAAVWWIVALFFLVSFQIADCYWESHSWTNRASHQSMSTLSRSQVSLKQNKNIKSHPFQFSYSVPSQCISLILLLFKIFWSLLFEWLVLVGYVKLCLFILTFDANNDFQLLESNINLPISPEKYNEYYRYVW